MRPSEAQSISPSGIPTFNPTGMIPLPTLQPSFGPSIQPAMAEPSPAPTFRRKPMFPRSKKKRMHKGKRRGKGKHRRKENMKMKNRKRRRPQKKTRKPWRKRKKGGGKWKKRMKRMNSGGNHPDIFGDRDEDRGSTDRDIFGNRSKGHDATGDGVFLGRSSNDRGDDTERPLFSLRNTGTAGIGSDSVVGVGT